MTPEANHSDPNWAKRLEDEAAATKDPEIIRFVQENLKPKETQPLEGIDATFLHPEVLRAYILDPERPRGITPEQRMAKVTGKELAAFSLPGGLFSSVSFRLLMEENALGRPTAIIRADFTLDGEHSCIKRFQSQKRKDEIPDDPEPTTQIMKILFERVADLEYGKLGMNDSSNAIILYPAIRGGSKIAPGYATPAVAVQVWEADNFAPTISISLFSGTRLLQALDEKGKFFENNEDELSTWQFLIPVGIPTSHESEFIHAIEFYEELLPIVTGAVYESEGFKAPNVSLEIEPQTTFRAEKDTTFEDIGGLLNVVEVLRARVLEEQQIERTLGTYPHIFLVGPAGTGKTSLIQATAHALSAPVIEVNSKVIADEGVQSIGLIDYLRAKFFEARSKAYAANGKAVLSLEGLEGIFAGSAYGAQEKFVHILEDWRDEEQVLVMATSVQPEHISQQLITRFHGLHTTTPTVSELAEIMRKQMRRFANLRGRDDLFGDVDVKKIVSEFPNGVGRDIVQLLGQAIAIARLRNRESGSWKPINTELLFGLRPPQRKIGFS